jgi:hypothetical protein
MYYIGQIIMRLQLLHVSGIMLGALILGMGIVLIVSRQQNPESIYTGD